jgi:hypothetical protein
MLALNPQNRSLNGPYRPVLSPEWLKSRGWPAGAFGMSPADTAISAQRSVQILPTHPSGN